MFSGKVGSEITLPEDYGVGEKNKEILNNGKNQLMAL